MDSSSGSQKNIRKVLRSRRISVPLVQPQKVDQKPVQPKNKKRRIDVARNDLEATATSKHDEIGDRPEICNLIGEMPKILEENVLNSDPPASSTVDMKNSETSKNKKERQVSNKNRNSEDEDNRSEIRSPDSVYKTQTFQNGSDNQDDKQDDSSVNNSDSESDDSRSNYIDNVLQEFGKDIGGLYAKTNNIESELKEIKEMLKARPPPHCIYRSISSRIAQKSKFSLLPQIPLLKRSHVRKMELNIHEDEDYAEQLIKKMASYGGNSVNEMVINIFKKLFSPKLKTKYCWKGTKKSKVKAAFVKLVGLTDALWSAVKVHFEDCTEHTINKEIKLRLNQAQKDYDRELKKNQM